MRKVEDSRIEWQTRAIVAAVAGASGDKDFLAGMLDQTTLLYREALTDPEPTKAVNKTPPRPSPKIGSFERLTAFFGSPRAQ